MPAKSKRRGLDISCISEAAIGVFGTVLCLLAGLVPTSASACDGPVFNTLPALGLRLGNTDGLVVRATRIEMTSSALVMTYEVENCGPERIFGRIYAPIAPIGLNLQNNAATFSGALSQNPLGLTATADGKPVELTTRAAAIFLGMDITGRLEAGGLGLSPFVADVEPDMARTLQAIQGAA